MHARLLALPVVVAVGLLSACGAGEGDGSVAANADVLVGDAPVDDLLSFSAVVRSVRLQRQDLTFTEDLSGSLRVEFLGLNGALKLLGKARIPTGTYVAVEIGFEPGSYAAKAAFDSSIVAIVASADTYLAPLTAPMAVSSGGYVRFAVDLDLATALTGVVANNTLDFAPAGASVANNGSTDAMIDELEGTVTAASLGTHTVSLDGFAGDPPVSVGRFTVLVDGTTLLLDEGNAPLVESAFFTSIGPGSTLEVHGNLVEGGTLAATRIEIEDSLGGFVRIQGLVTALAADQFALRIQEIEDGASIAQPVLDGLVDGNAIAAGFDAGTAFLFDQGGLTDSSSLAVGQLVKVRFSAFATEPFPASEVEIDGPSAFHGVLTDLSGTPERMTLRLDADDPAVRAGLVTAGTDVTLVRGSAPLVLSVPGTPGLALSELHAGLELEARGLLAGTPEAPVLHATEVRVRPGYLQSSRLQHVAAGGGNLVVDGGEFVDPFGAGVTPGPLLIWIEEGCTFGGDIRTAEDFFRRYGRELALGAELDVRGLPNGSANEIRAFALRVKGR